MPAMGPVTPYWSTRCGYVYGCRIDADGTFRTGPAGWTAERISAGLYEVVHHLGTLDYAPVPAIAAVGGEYRAGASIQERDENKLRVSVFDNVQIADLPFVLMVFTL